MGEHQQRTLEFTGAAPSRLKSLREIFGFKTYFIGHGQQLARRRLQGIAAANTKTYAKTPFLSVDSRQVRRRAARLAAHIRPYVTKIRRRAANSFATKS